MTASILVADDHDIARAGLIAMIGGQEDFHVALDVRDGTEAVEAAALHKPDLALLDILSSLVAYRVQAQATTTLRRIKQQLVTHRDGDDRQLLGD